MEVKFSMTAQRMLVVESDPPRSFFNAEAPPPTAPILQVPDIVSVDTAPGRSVTFTSRSGTVVVVESNVMIRITGPALTANIPVDVRNMSTLKETVRVFRNLGKLSSVSEAKNIPEDLETKMKGYLAKGSRRRTRRHRS